MAVIPKVLYDGIGNPEYFSTEETSQILAEVYTFHRSKRAFETAPLGDSKRYTAKALISSINAIRTLIPKEIRERVGLHLEDDGISDSDLKGLEGRCRKALD